MHCAILGPEERHGDPAMATARLPFVWDYELLSLRDLVEGWPSWRGRIRSQTRRRGLDFLVEWVPRERPDLL